MKLAIAGRLSGTPRRVMLAELLSWWTEQMRDLAAPLARRASGWSRDALVLACHPGAPGDAPGPAQGAGPPPVGGEAHWRVLRRREGVITELARLSGDATSARWREAFEARRRGEPVVVTIGRPFLVRRTTLPLAAAANLDRLLRYEMDRLTPFAVDEVLFSHRVLSRDIAGGTLLVELAVVPKAWVKDPLDRLTALSVRPGTLEEPSDLVDTDYPGPGALFPPAARPRPGPAPRQIALDHADPAHHARARLAWRIGTAACATLAAAVIAVPFIHQSLALASVDDQIARLRPGMNKVDALRRQIAAGSAGAGQISAARSRAAAALRALGVLTDLLPDDTFLTSISLRRDHLTIEGRSTAATKLIATMASDPQLTNPSFGAPVVRAENGTDVFTIQAGFGS